ncbi:hypothetical protein GALMADRAFT_1232599 [Galerina marginata CBS 339.88]|uniref:Uncharacterized protein n=1 Tax=Galerina marginata (strain CBS 339.88) TaxID=685588 RepID=A0A067THB6_GALM3|nr:hypothetical protein GALMADRAFT_1232599 [Galerina marginata CBS 339.88]
MHYYYLCLCISSLVLLIQLFYPGFQFFDNVNFCVKVLPKKLPGLEKLLQTPLGRAQLIAALSICAEQAFTQASAKKWGFSTAFLIALSNYVKSTVMEDVNKAIGVLQDQGDLLEEQLVHIITKHPIRINNDSTG